MPKADDTTEGFLPPSPEQFAGSRRPRIKGVDAARGAALLGMLAVNVLPAATADHEPTMTTMMLAGHASALFAVLAGVSLAFISGGRRRFLGRPLLAAKAGLAVRALLILGLGLLLGYAEPGPAIILAYYGVMFLLAVPLLGLPPWALAVLAVGSATLAPALLLGLQGDLPTVQTDNPTFTDIFEEPVGSAVLLTFTGFYPAVPWMAYICAGMVIGRLNLSSRRSAAWLLAGGVLLALLAWGVSAFLLGPAGGFGQLVASSPGLAADDVNEVFVYGPDSGLPGGSWWWLAVMAPYSSMPLELLHTIGTSAAALGLVLLLGKAFDPIIGVLAPAGSMTLTLYSAHLLFVSTRFLGDRPFVSLAVQAGAAVIFAVVWHSTKGKGPLEGPLGALSEKVRNRIRHRRRAALDPAAE
ncbi:DUF1624 domain-containing protein [Arthrobacter sp. VKM Ac-2550]|uniref:DUF1624 domain-containing protein n=1 Tax=Crystallibacter permensis TaxID=1938888 RepID=UPI002228017C|nr:DUF1624 domain-containing protein [Arthrobacter sp. VKM Ac-2550]MCW2134160.1 Protein of unknown function (DUF1624) [Arthrobacter sp. VKM Ac-2550]